MQNDDLSKALAADVARLRPEHDSPFNEGYLARTHGLPKQVPADSEQPLGWEAGWETADETPPLHWPWVKEKLLLPPAEAHV